MKITVARFVCVAVLLGSCAKYMDEQPPDVAIDSVAMRDSVLRAVRQNIPGVWIRKIATKPGEEGFTLKNDGSVNLVNYYTMHGNRWEISNDTLAVFTYSDVDTVPKPRFYKVVRISDSVLELAPQGAPIGYVEEYHKRRINLPATVTTLFHEEFIGKLQPMQIVEHPFTVKNMFDGTVKILSENPNVLFTLKKSGALITDRPVRKWQSSFPPGNYIIYAVYKDSRAEKTLRAEYTVVVEETEE